MKELRITINKVLKDWLQPKGGGIVFTDYIAINEVTDEIVAECQRNYSELLQQRDELKEAFNQMRQYWSLIDIEADAEQIADSTGTNLKYKL